MRQKLFSSDRSHKNGFTLLELLIVITILAILAVIVTFVLNPVETLRKSRDVQRMSDLATIKNAIALYTTTVATPDLGTCLGVGITTAQIYYSKPVADAACAVTVTPGAGTTTSSTFGTTADFCAYVASPNGSVDGTGWIPVDLTDISSGSPISNYPIDPTNTVAVNTAPTSADLVYRYACQETAATGFASTVFELNANLESAEFINGGSGDKETADGGDNTALYEVGTNLKLMGAGTNF